MKRQRGGEEPTIRQRGDQIEISKENDFCKMTVTIDKSKFQRGDVPEPVSKFQRGNTPAILCFVCHREILELEKLKQVREADEHSEAHYKMQGIVAEKVVILYHHRQRIFRHAETCEPGSPRYMKNETLAKSYLETFGGK